MGKNTRIFSKVKEEDGSCSIMEFRSQEFWAQFMDLV
jgi:hypothetical protein